MQSWSDPAVEETSMSPSLDMMEEVEVWHQVLTQYLTEELNSFKSALGAFKQDLQHNLDELRAELSSHIRQELQKMRDNLERKFVADLSSLYETHHSGMKVMEERITSMGECLSTRLQALEQKVGELAGAGTSPLLQHQMAQQIGNDRRPAGAPTSPVDPGAFPSSSPSPASLQPLTVGAPPLQTGPSTDMLESLLELAKAEFLENDASLLEVAADAPPQQAGTATPYNSFSSSQLTSPDTTSPPCPSQVKAAPNLDDLEPALASALEPHMPTRLSRQEKLSAVQCAFFSCKFEELAIKDAKDLHLKALRIQRDGVKGNIWPPGWKPLGTTSLEDFLAEKIKTTLKKKRRASQVKEELMMSVKKAKKGAGGAEGHC